MNVVTNTQPPSATTEGMLSQIVRHGGIFGAAAILSRLASVLLLPLYTRMLSPADYGIIALVDLTSNLLAIVAGAGIASAALRAHTSGDDSPGHYARIWWTALLVTTLTATVTFGSALVFRTPLSRFAFGEGTSQFADYLALGLAATWVLSITVITDSYFRAMKRSWFVVTLSLSRLLLNIALNVAFLVWLRLGVAGILLGNLLSAVVSLLIQAYVFRAEYPRVVFNRARAKEYFDFGWPLIAAGLLSAVLHEADRFLLRGFTTLHQVGLYSVGYTIAQGVNSLCVGPFLAVWGVLVYEVGRESHARETYARVFRHASLGIALVLFATSMFARPLIGFLTTPEFAYAADIIPVVCLAYWFFSLHDQFKTPALLTGRTLTTLPTYIVAAAVNIGLNLILIPRFGAMGAAWASVVTFAVFSFTGLFLYRKIAQYDYPIGRSLLVVAGMVASFLVMRVIPSPVGQFVVAAVASLAWLVFLFPMLISKGVSTIIALTARRRLSDAGGPTL